MVVHFVLILPEMIIPFAERHCCGWLSTGDESFKAGHEGNMDERAGWGLVNHEVSGGGAFMHLELSVTVIRPNLLHLDILPNGCSS